ncbi:MAG: transporter permease subunit [Flavipsychrobacter sp.]|jgi:Cu-processing system permease protein|nr:transporter permease subunit [Flavipsychrobacter sp.]
MGKIIKYILLDIIKNKIVIAYTIFLLAITLSVFSLEDNSQKGMLTLLNLVLFIVPLVSIIFSTIYIYNSSEYIELLISQPIQRKSIWLSIFVGLSSALTLAFLLGVGLPLLLFEQSAVSFMMTAMGVFISIIFVVLAMLASVTTRDKAKGIGITILLWIYFSLLFDGLILFLLFQFADYPLEKPMVGVSMLNPLDLGRILILLKMDISALMGYTGAIFKDFFGTKTGMALSVTVMFLWVLLPLLYSLRKFKHKDL